MSMSVCLEESWALLACLFPVVELMGTNVHLGSINKVTICRIVSLINWF